MSTERNRTPGIVDLTPALSARLWHVSQKPRLGLWGTLLLSNAVWLGLVAILAVAVLISSNMTSWLASYQIQQQVAWAETQAKDAAKIKERDLEIARLVAFQDSSPADVVALARKLSVILNSAEGEHREFLEKALPHAIRIQVQRGIPASAVMAQAIYESGYGSSPLATDHNNFFGLKAFDDWNGSVAPNMPTIDLGKKTFANFRAYNTLKEGFEGYVNFLTDRSRYAAAFQTRDGLTFVERLLEAGYCPDHDYLDRIEVIMERHRLQELDNILKEAVSKGGGDKLNTPTRAARIPLSLGQSG